MIRKIARFTIRKGTTEVVEEAIREFVDAVEDSEPETDYRSYRESGGRTYIHLMAFVDAAAEKRHRHAPYTRRFVEALRPNCEQEPTFVEVSRVA